MQRSGRYTSWRVGVGRRMRRRRVRARRMRRMRGAGMTVRPGGIPRRMAVGKGGMMRRTMRWMGRSQRRWRRGWDRVVKGRRQRRPHNMWLKEKGAWGLRRGLRASGRVPGPGCTACSTADPTCPVAEEEDGDEEEDDDDVQFLPSRRRLAARLSASQEAGAGGMPLVLPRATHSPHTGLFGATNSRAPFPTASLRSGHSDTCKRHNGFAPPACCFAHWFPPPFVDKHLSLSSYHAQLTHPTQVSFRQRSHRLHSRQHLCAEGSDMAVSWWQQSHGLHSRQNLCAEGSDMAVRGIMASRLTTRNSLIPHRYFGDNDLTGSIPDSISALTALELLSLGGNSLTGSIPDSIFALTALKSLDLSSNSLTGSIPDSITALRALGYLNLRKNNLTGPIPDSLPVPQWFFPSASPPPPKPADGGLVPRWADPSTSPPPPKPSGRGTPVCLHTTVSLPLPGPHPFSPMALPSVLACASPRLPPPTLPRAPLR
ncbi:unnamed protein product [Closterium sp. NIES-53]